MKKLGYYAFLLLIGSFRLIPFRLLYLFSDQLTFLFYHVIRYRKTMILNNLRTCFPDKKENEIQEICKNSYRNLCDILLEALKGFSLSKEEIAERYQFEFNEDLDHLFKNGLSAVGATAHLTNWEWGAYASGISLKHHIIGVYKKLSQPYINSYMIRARSKFNVTLCEMKEISPYLDSLKSDETCLVMLIADQRPSDPLKAYWTTFLNRDTAFFYGMEKFAFQYQLPVFFFNIHRIKRGYYRVKIELICRDVSQLKKGEIIEKYKEALEREVMSRPADWLWSHSRWKHAKPKEISTQV